MNKHYKKTENQDQYIVETCLLDLSHCHFFAVVDGHGINGREISLKVKKRLRQLVENELEHVMQFGEIRFDLKKEYPYQRLFEQVINKAFDAMQLEIDEMIEDGRYSGCTCTSALIFGNQVYVANLGDSRTIMIRKKVQQKSAK